jgi:hypothetical protein
MDDQSAGVLLAPIPKPAVQRPQWNKLRRSTRVCIVLTRLLILTVLLELVSRAYWFIAKGVPPFRTGQIVCSYLPEIKEAKLYDAPCEQNGSTLSVLVLGPSVWFEGFGDLAARFEKELAAKLGRQVHVYNASCPGHTTRDAFVVYRFVPKQRFDLVVVYHGINDTFLNNSRPELFRLDYSHAPRFEQIRLLDARPEHAWFVLPYTLCYTRSRVGEKLQIDPRPRHELAEKYGMNLQTPPAVRANIQGIIDLSRARKAQVLLLTNAWHLPSDYTEEAFAAKSLDYDQHCSPIATWGTVESVSAGMKAHNEVVRALAHENNDVLFADMEKLMPHGKQYFNDVCHFNAKGCEVFVDLLMQHGEWNKLMR